MLGITLALIVTLLTIVARWPYTMWPLHGAAIGLIAATSAWAVDETTATIVDRVPIYASPIDAAFAYFNI